MYDKLYAYLESYGYSQACLASVNLYDDNHFFVTLTNDTKMNNDTEAEIEKSFEAKHGVKLDIVGNTTWLTQS